MIKKYWKQNNTWDDLGRLPVQVGFSNGKCLAFKTSGDKLLFVDGQSGPEGEEAVVVYSWCPRLGVINCKIEWEVLGRKEGVGVSISSCDVMGC